MWCNYELQLFRYQFLPLHRSMYSKQWILCILQTYNKTWSMLQIDLPFKATFFPFLCSQFTRIKCFYVYVSVWLFWRFICSEALWSKWNEREWTKERKRERWCEWLEANQTLVWNWEPKVLHPIRNPSCSNQAQTTIKMTVNSHGAALAILRQPIGYYKTEEEVAFREIVP